MEVDLFDPKAIDCYTVVSSKKEAIESKATNGMYEFASIIQGFQAELIRTFEMDGAKAMELVLQHAMDAQADRGPRFVLSQEDQLEILKFFQTTWRNLALLRGVCMGFYAIRPVSQGPIQAEVICNSTVSEIYKNLIEDPLTVIVRDQLGHEITSKLGF